MGMATLICLLEVALKAGGIQNPQVRESTALLTAHFTSMNRTHVFWKMQGWLPERFGATWTEMVFQSWCWLASGGPFVCFKTITANSLHLTFRSILLRAQQQAMPPGCPGCNCYLLNLR